MDRVTLRKHMEENPDAKLRDLVMKLLYDEIVSLRIAPGTKLNVNQMASNLGVSRTPVAEAIGSLAEIGFVVSHPGQTGSFAQVPPQNPAMETDTHGVPGFLKRNKK